MIIDFQLQQNNLKQYIDNNYQKHLDKILIDKFTTVTDFLDFDKYKQDFIVNIDFDNITFPTGNFNDDCSILERLIVNIFLVHRNNSPDKLNEKMLTSSAAFYELLQDMESDNLFFDISINRIDFFKYIEGTTNIMASRFVLQIDIEI